MNIKLIIHFMKAIFSRNDDVNKIAFVNWRMNHESTPSYMINMADGYMRSAIILAKQCLICNSDKKADIIIFPILMNVNHGIELYLKAMNWMLDEIQNIDPKIQGKHNINQIYRMLKSKIKNVFGITSLRSFENAMEELESYIDELTVKIEATAKKDNMDFSRYPISNDRVNHFYVDRFKNVEVDLENFIKRFEVIEDQLSFAAQTLYDVSEGEKSKEEKCELFK